MTQTARTVLLYSDRPQVREQMRQAVGTRPAPDLEVEFVEASTYAECISLVDTYRIDLLLLDGEAQPVGGMGIARQLRDERDHPPPVCIAIARAADRWLAAYSQADATIIHPLDPVTTGQTVAALLHRRATGIASAR